MTVIGALLSFRELGKMSPHKRPCIDWFGHLWDGWPSGSWVVASFTTLILSAALIR
jgi:hypothetical protein